MPIYRYTVMDIQPLILSTSPTPLSVKTAQLNLSQLLLGQILNAAVVSKKSSELFVLQIGNQQIEAKTDKGNPLNIGEQLKLIVEKQGEPVTLRVLQQSSAKVVYEAKQQLLRESMPKQAGMEKLTNVLNLVSKNIKDVIKSLPAPIEQQFKKLIEQLPVKNNINNETGLKTAIKNSGIFLEAKLLIDANRKSESLLKTTSRTTQASKQRSSQTQNLAQHLEITKDLKTNLLQLSDVISKYKQSIKTRETIKEAIFVKQAQMASSETTENNLTKTNSSNKAADPALKLETEMLSKHIESSIARIEVNQSKAIITHDNLTPLWSIEMPVKDKQDIDLLKLNIQADRDSKSNEEKQQRWTTDLKITFENVGTISAKLSVINKEVNATLWSDNETLNDLINNNLSLLNKQIEKCGLSTGNIVCRQEAPFEQIIPQTANNLINITI